MATPTSKPVTRVTRDLFTSRYIGSKPRALVVTVGPGDTLCIRPQGLREGEYISILDVFEYARTKRMQAQHGVIKAGRRALG